MRSNAAMPENIKVCVFTGTRAEYGHLYWLLKDIDQNEKIELQLLVSGAHLSPEFGSTYQVIEKDGFHINEKVEMLLSSDTPLSIAKSVGLGCMGYAEAFSRMQPDCVLILGDRYEALAAAQAAFFLRIPVAHLHGGEITEGAYDDPIRHCITKLSTFHFVANESYAKRVEQLGESPNSIFCVGSVGLEHLTRSKLLTIEELSESIDFQLTADKFFLFTYHPETMSNIQASNQLKACLEAMDKFPEYKILFTYPNADDGGREIIRGIEAYIENNRERAVAVKSLGQVRYLSAVKFCSAVVGNSSSGISEVPSFKVPTINIGNRQTGRLFAPSVVTTPLDGDSIAMALNHVLTGTSYSKGQPVENPYGDGNACTKIIAELKKQLPRQQRAKKFFDF